MLDLDKKRIQEIIQNHVMSDELIEQEKAIKDNDIVSAKGYVGFAIQSYLTEQPPIYRKS